MRLQNLLLHLACFQVDPCSPSSVEAFQGMVLDCFSQHGVGALGDLMLDFGSILKAQHPEFPGPPRVQLCYKQETRLHQSWLQQLLWFAM